MSTAVATATDTRVLPQPAAPAAGGAALDVTPAEAELLRAGLAGDWIELLVALWPSWGFCPRHALGFASLELELQDRLFSTSIYYQHFVEAAAEIAGARFRTWRGIRYCLTPRAGCVICERLDAGKAAGLSALAEQVNRRRRLDERLEEARTSWRERACPLCVEGGEGIVCRLHVLAGAKQDELGPQLVALQQRLRRFIGSMCAQKTETDSLDRFSWLETIAWFGGWEHPQRLLLERGDADEH
jgi:hypothetical protein